MQTINGYQCRFEHSVTDSEAENVVFLNGILNKAQSWHQQVELIQEMGLNTLNYDFRGQWYSETTQGPYSLKLLAEDLAALMDHCGIEKAHLVGTSYGGFVTQQFALMYPERVSSVVIITSSPLITGRSRHIVNNWCYFNNSGENIPYYDAMLAVIFSEEFFSKHSEALEVRREWFGDVVKTLPHFAEGQYLLNKASLDDLDGDGLLNQIGQIRCPAHIVAAGNDIIYPPKFSKMIAERIDGAIYSEIQHSGHAVVLESSDQINAILKSHLNNLR